MAMHDVVYHCSKRPIDDRKIMLHLKQLSLLAVPDVHDIYIITSSLICWVQPQLSNNTSNIALTTNKTLTLR